MHHMKKAFIVFLVAVAIAPLSTWVLVSAGPAPTSVAASDIKQLLEFEQISGVVEAIPEPKATQPEWYKKQVAAEQAAAQAAARASAPSRGGGRTFTYTIGTKGTTRSDLAEFSAQANETLNSSRGWAQLGVNFKQVSSGGMFNLILSEASQVPTFSSGCSAQWSCRVGVSVIINDDRWQGGTTAWNNAGGGIRDYRHMVINHEVGHWLGHGHIPCSAPGAYAPLMLQQSIDLGGCRFNPWPLDSELWTSR